MASENAATASSALQIPDPTHLGSGPVQLLQVGIAFLAITWVTMALRAYTRIFLIRSFGWDDWTMLLTMVSFTVQCAFMIRLGVREQYPEDNKTLVAIAGLVTDIIAFSAAYVITTVVLKISLAFFFLRIVVKKWQRNVIFYTTGVYTMYAMVYFCVVTFGCGDPAKFLIHTAEGKCLSIKGVTIPMSYVQTSLNAVMDWIYVLLPMHTLWGLQMPRSTKIWASLLILLGALGSIASLIRLESVDGLEPGRDFFRKSVPTAIWATIEPGLGIAAVSLATTRPLFRRFIESTRTGYSRDRSNIIPAEPSSRRELSSKGLILSPRSAPVRAGFVEFGSLDRDVELADVQVHHNVNVHIDLEKRRFEDPYPQTTRGDWV